MVVVLSLGIKFMPASYAPTSSSPPLTCFATVEQNDVYVNYESDWPTMEMSFSIYSKVGSSIIGLATVNYGRLFLAPNRAAS